MNKKSLNIPESDLPHFEEDLKENFQRRIFRIMDEFVEGFHFVSDFDKAVTFFGSSRFEEDNVYYKKARELSSLLTREGFAIITGGGPGIMEAANRGSFENEGRSIGINIQLTGGQERANKYLKESIAFYYFFTRKVMLSFSSHGYVFFPGGFGTLDEFFEVLTLLQTKKIPQTTSIVAVGKDYWEPLFNWFKEELAENYETIDPEDLDRFSLVDHPKEAFELIKKAVPYKR